MSRYKCPLCEREWSTENMAPVCGDCAYKNKDELHSLRAEVAEARQAVKNVAYAQKENEQIESPIFARPEESEVSQ